LLQKRIQQLDITAEEREELADLFRNLSLPEVRSAMQKAVDQVCRKLPINDLAARTYYAETIRELAPRIETAIVAGGWENIFVCLQGDATRYDAMVFYMDGEPMDDRKLRLLIEQINDCHAAADKIVLVRQQVHSLQDLIEVLNVCFWGDEGRGLLAGLENREHDLLRQYIREKPDEWRSDSGWEEWL
jgi:hypothetical protein